jgi:hypothetical protein
MSVMNGVRLPGDSTVQQVKVDVPEPGMVRCCCG